MNKKLKIGIDFHGVIDSNYVFFREFNDLSMEKGHQIYVITGGSNEEISALLEKNRIKYSYLFSLKDFFEKQGVLKILEDGRFWVSDELWNAKKAEYCLENKIDIHIDDCSKYLEEFKTTFCLYDKTKAECTFSNYIKIDFSETPKQVLTELEAIFFPNL